MITQAENIQIDYTGDEENVALDNVTLEVNAGDFVAIQGPSGSGKSTLLFVLGCLLEPDEGEIYFDQKKISDLSDKELAQLRSEEIGFIFQNSHLVPTLTVFENIATPLSFRRHLARKEKKEILSNIDGIADRFGIKDKLERLPYQLSLGERRRVAIARALVNNPALILADEPTAGLDPKRARQVVEMLSELSCEKRAVIMVTHDPEMANKAPRQFRLVAGKLIDETK